MSSDTELQVLAGGPNSGKTTMIEALSREGYVTVPESARAYIDRELSKGNTKDEIYNDPGFQESIIEMDRKLEEAVPDDYLLFSDRSLVEGVAYARYFCGEDRPEILEEVEGKYDNVLLLERLPFEEDYARREDEEEAREIHREIEKVYREAGYEPIDIPVLPVEERVERIESHIEDEKLEKGRIWTL